MFVYVCISCFIMCFAYTVLDVNRFGEASDRRDWVGGEIEIEIEIEKIDSFWLYRDTGDFIVVFVKWKRPRFVGSLNRRWRFRTESVEFPEP